MKPRQFMFGLVLSAVMGGSMAIGGYKLLEDDEPVVQVQPEQPTRNFRYSSLMRDSEVKVPEGLNFVTAAEAVTPAVVHVMTEYGTELAKNNSRRQDIDPFFRDFFFFKFPFARNR